MCEQRVDQCSWCAVWELMYTCAKRPGRVKEVVSRLPGARPEFTPEDEQPQSFFSVTTFFRAAPRNGLVWSIPMLIGARRNPKPFGFHIMILWFAHDPAEYRLCRLLLR